MSERKDVLVSEAELVELFRRRRPDPAAFRARIAERIAEKERGESESADAPRERASVRAEFLRRAAAFLPLDPSGGVAFGKVFLTSLALPFLVLAASVGAFVAAARSVVRSGDAAKPATVEPGPFTRTSSRRLQFSGVFVQLIQAVGILALVTPGATGSAWAVDIVVGLVLFAAATLVVVVRALSDHALMTPRRVATHATAILGSLFVGAFLWPASRRAAAAGSDLDLGWSVGVVLAGIVVCALLPRKMPSWTTWFCLLFVPPLLVLNPLGLTRTSPASLGAQIASYGVDAHDLRGWAELGYVAEALKSAGEEVPPLPEVERELDRALSGPIRGPLHVWTAGADAHSRVWTAASQAGLMTHERWCALAEHGPEKRKLDQLLKMPGRLSMPDYEEYQFPMLLATREVTREQREALAARAEAAWPAGESTNALGEALLVVRLLDHLGLRERADERRADVHALLSKHWTGNTPLRLFKMTGGFTPDPRTFETSMPGATHAAVVLMVRFGVPPGIDLRSLRSYLRPESAAFWIGIPEPSYLKGVQRAALLRLEREIGIPSRSVIEAILGERVLIACVLLVLLCLLAIGMAPRVGGGRGRGALP